MKAKLTSWVLLLSSLCMVGSVWAGEVVVKGSTTVLPVAQKAAESFMKEHPDISVNVSGGGSGFGIKAIIDGTTDIADTSRFIKDEEVKKALDNGRYPVPFGVALDSIIPVVHPSNSVDNLSSEALKAIYKGEIRNWKKVGGPDRPIVVVSRDTSSGTYEVWESRVLEGARVTPRAQLLASNGAVAQAVAGNKNAIGYIGLGYLNKDLKNVKIDGIKGCEETAQSGEYPVSRTLFMFTNGWPQGEVKMFINYILNPEKGQELVEEVGYVSKY